MVHFFNLLSLFVLEAMSRQTKQAKNVADISNAEIDNVNQVMTNNEGSMPVQQGSRV